MLAIQTLLQQSIDYAGLFPPAGLDMATAVANFSRYRSGPAVWALGRFIVPVNRLAELETAAEPHLPRNPAPHPWQLGALAGPNLAADLEAVEQFNRRHAARGSAVAVDTIEVKATSEAGVEDTMRRVPPGLRPYIEIPIDRDPSRLITAIGRLGGRAKVRTGGVSADAFPAAADLLRFLRACVRAGVPFKATAGLHHPIRGEYRLTYAPDSACGTMFGFLNLVLATAFLRVGMEEEAVRRVLEEGSPEAFQADGRGLTWRGHRLGLEALRGFREHGMVAFGSCSFTEPLDELAALHLLDAGVQPA
jgi:hypothetical protein